MIRPSQDSERAILRWMAATALAVVVALIVGGITRLTESGLSITEWKPLSGALPPLSQAHWDEAYQKYLLIPEAQTVHRGITLVEFKTLFWWEWIHRNLARVVGLVIAAPFFWLLARRRLPLQWLPRMAVLPVLVAAQGALGWYMVRSGLSGRTDVSQYRLVAHLGLALVIFVIAIWTAATIVARQRTELASSGSTVRDRAGIALAALTFLTILSGGFVAGLDAGHVFNTFPLMGGQLVPPAYGQLSPVWRNWFENAGAAQFNHRVLATTTMLVALGLSVVRWRDGRGSQWRWVGLAAVAQFGLGVTTLLLAVPVSVAALHQLGAVILLSAALWAAASPAHSSASVTTAPRTSPTTDAATLDGYPRRARKA